MNTTVETKRLKKIGASESIVNDELRTFDESAFPVGTVAHQGDLILVLCSRRRCYSQSSQVSQRQRSGYDKGGNRAHGIFGGTSSREATICSWLAGVVACGDSSPLCT